MAKYRITAPSGEKFEITAPEDASQEQIMAYAQQQFQSQPTAPETPKVTSPKNYTLPESIGNAALNFAPDLGNVVIGAGKALLHPIDTLSNVGKAAMGGVANAAEAAQSNYNDSNRIFPKGQYNLPRTNVQGMQQGIQEAQGPANALGQFYKDRYGSYEGFKRALAEHPAEVMSDVSAVLGGGAALTTGGKLGNALAKTSEYTNPLKPAQALGGAVLKGTGNTLAGALGVTTGVGGDTVKAAYNAGKEGNSSFWDNLTGKTDPTEVLDIAKNALSNMKVEKNKAYRSGMVDVSGDKTVLDFSNIDDSLANATDKVSFKGQIKDKVAAQKVKEAQNEINKWKNLDPTEYHTPEGMDALKQKIGGILESIPFEQKTARSAVQDIYNSTRKTIADQAPSYDKVMKDYSEASDLITQIQKSLSLNEKASVDTAMRKLQSLTRNNVQTNYGQRVKLAEELAKYGGENIMPSLAGQAMSEWSPRGMVGKGEDLAAIYAAFTHPTALAAFPLAMPRVVGSAAYGAGKIAGKAPKLPITADKANQMAQLLYQMHNASNQGEQ